LTAPSRSQPSRREQCVHPSMDGCERNPRLKRRPTVRKMGLVRLQPGRQISGQVVQVNLEVWLKSAAASEFRSLCG
ncbi:hypothetical protein CLOM_g5845, partial [Closterium sp. NIES-68]